MSESPVSGASVSVTASTYAINSLLNVNFNAGDEIQVYMAGTGVPYPRAELVFARRISG
jgi:hypothetical protein